MRFQEASWRRTAASGAVPARREQSADVIDETHVQHAVRFVQDQNLNLVQPDFFWPRRSSRRPGVATTTSMPRSKSRTCRSWYTRRIRRLMPVVAGCCISGSCHGFAPQARGSAPALGRGCPGAGPMSRARKELETGNAKAAVLPVPVCAQPSRSRPKADRDGLPLDGRRLGVMRSAQGVLQGLDEPEFKGYSVYEGLLSGADGAGNRTEAAVVIG